MIYRAARIAAASPWVVAFSASAHAAQNNGNGPSKEDILAACDATHNACIDVFNRSISEGPGADFLHTACENDCNDTEFACRKSAAKRSNALIRTLPAGAISI